MAARFLRALFGRQSGDAVPDRLVIKDVGRDPVASAFERWLRTVEEVDAAFTVAGRRLHPPMPIHEVRRLRDAEQSAWDEYRGHRGEG